VSGTHAGLKKSGELIVNAVPIAICCDELRPVRASGEPVGAGCGPFAGHCRGGAAHPPRVHFVVAQMRFVGTGMLAEAHTPTLRCA